MSSHIVEIKLVDLTWIRPNQDPNGKYLHCCVNRTFYKFLYMNFRTEKHFHLNFHCLHLRGSIVTQQSLKITQKSNTDGDIWTISIYWQYWRSFSLSFRLDFLRWQSDWSTFSFPIWISIGDNSIDFWLDFFPFEFKRHSFFSRLLKNRWIFNCSTILNQNLTFNSNWVGKVTSHMF